MQRHVLLTFLSPLLVALALTTATAPVHAQTGTKAKVPADPRNDDRTAIRASLESFVKAFESRDAKALAANWTADGEYNRDDGVSIQGRPAIEKAFADFFAKTPEVKAEIEPQ